MAKPLMTKEMWIELINCTVFDTHYGNFLSAKLSNVEEELTYETLEILKARYYEEVIEWRIEFEKPPKESDYFHREEFPHDAPDYESRIAELEFFTVFARHLGDDKAIIRFSSEVGFMIEKYMGEWM